MVERLVRYNVETDTGEQISMRHRWTFAIINQPREIDRIKKRILGEFMPTDNYLRNYHEQIPYSGGLHLRIFSFSSGRGIVDSRNKRAIYNSKNFKVDRNLSEKDEDKYWAYALRLIRG